jgi:urea carboxylase-associated protein 2
MDENPIYSLTLNGAGMWSKVVGRGKRLRLTDLEGGANVGMLLYNALERTERYNMPDTLKGQQVFFLTEGRCLHSDMGRLLASVTADTAGWHDTVCGHADAALVEEKYGNKTFADARNDFHRDAHGCFLIELAKWGLGERDLVPNLNWFSKVTADAGGHLTFQPNPSPPGAHVDLRFELDTLVVLNTCRHPLDPSLEYAPRPVRLDVFPAAPPPDPATDPCLTSHPENRRAFENTQAYHLLRF